MNTPGHAVLNVALLGGGRRHTGPIVAGAVAPDATLFLFYLWQRAILDVPEHVIWNTLYFAPHWQTVFDLGHSLPLALLGFAVARGIGRDAAAAFFASAALHALLDLPVHHDDAHRHFLPLSDWQFLSPLSYWDPHHHGTTMAALEAVMVLALSGWLWGRFDWRGRTALAGVCALYATAYWGFYLRGWVWG